MVVRTYGGKPCDAGMHHRTRAERTGSGLNPNNRDAFLLNWSVLAVASKHRFELMTARQAMA